MTQIALPLGWPAGPRDDAFLVGAANAQAVQMLDRWGAWPVRTALLVGPRKSGRSLLARVFAGRSGGEIIDDAERIGEDALFHAWNAAQAGRRPLLLVAAQPPPVWLVALPDLRSRLAASPVATIHPPDDALIRDLLRHLLDRRSLPAPPDLVDWLAARLERSYVAIDRAIDALDLGATERRKRLSIPFARTMLADIGLIAPGTPS